MASTTRDLDRRLVGGVCAGIANRYEYDIIGVRLVAVLLAVVTAGLGGLAYVAAWRLLPTADASTALLGPPASSLSPSAPSPSKGEGWGGGDSTTLTATAPAAAIPLQELYGAVAMDLPLVDQALRSIADVRFPWLREMLQSLTGGGKKLRPAIALLAGRCGEYDLQLLVPVAASVELLHTATLVHDDVIDEAEQRRGRPTAAALFGNAASVMLGDYMFAHAADFVAQTGNVRVVRNFAATLRVMASGELQQDISAFEYSEDVQRYLDRIGGKTASLFATAAEGGAIVAGAPEPQVQALRAYGEALGMAFQVVDDILDLAGDAAVMGKPVGSDLREGTLTLPTLFYMQTHPEDNAVRLAFDDVDREANLERAIAGIRASDAIARARETAEHFGQRAREALTALPDGETRTTLARLVDYVLEREN